VSLRTGADPEVRRLNRSRRVLKVDLHPDIERLALLGWRLHPASCRTRAACFADATALATHDLDRLTRWSREYPACSWRVVMEGSGIWALDVDVPSQRHKHDGATALRNLVSVHGSLPPRPTTRSGGGGLALFFEHRAEPIVGKSGHPAPGLDPRRGRQSVTVPPSIHTDTGLPYRWLVAPWELAPPQAPGWLLRLVAPPPRAAFPGSTTAACR
jgi:Bifunctional DNA primase/polymerase, N-terminal